jgi:ferredoxin-NADP reductase
MTRPRTHYQVRVAEVISETDAACSLVLDIPAELADVFSYRPGQFLTVRVPSGGGSVARCYSLSSSPHAGEAPAITIKRTDGGYASNWIADSARPGGVLDVLPPAGTFCPDSLEGDFLLFAAGSGITPVMSILKSALAAGHGRIVLVYANRDERSVIFSAQLRRLAAETDRLLVVHWLDSLHGPPTVAGMAALAPTWRPSGRRSAGWACPRRACTWSGSCRWRTTRSRSPSRPAARPRRWRSASMARPGGCHGRPGPACSTSSSTRASTRRTPAGRASAARARAS